MRVFRTSKTLQKTPLRVSDVPTRIPGFDAQNDGFDAQHVGFCDGAGKQWGTFEQMTVYKTTVTSKSVRLNKHAGGGEL